MTPLLCLCGCGTELQRTIGRGQSPRYAKGHWPSRKIAAFRRHAVPRVCKWCERPFLAQAGNVKRGNGTFCSRKCSGTFSGRKRTSAQFSITQLRTGQRVPLTEPRRYRDAQGYIRLRWKIAPQTYVEVREHRVVDGVVCGLVVHHVNGIKSDNRPENLKVVTPAEHARIHAEMRRHGKAQRHEITV